MPLRILERKVECKEGKEVYNNTNKSIAGMKKYLKQKELIEADNIQQAKIQAEQRAFLMQQVMRSQKVQNQQSAQSKTFSTDLNGNTVLVKEINANNLKDLDCNYTGVKFTDLPVEVK